MSLTITWLGHSTVVIDVDGVRLVSDPLLARHAGILRRRGDTPERVAWRGADAVLLSHLHHDHADLPSLRRVGPDVPVIAAPGSRGLLERRGCGAVTELAPGESTRVGEVVVTAVEARHPSESRFERRSEAVGFLLCGGGRRVYFAGDTDLFEGMAGLDPELDLALLPIWGWGPSLGPGHLDPERAARAAALLSPRIVVPIHWGTLYPLGLARLRPGPLRSPPRRFEAWMRELAPQVEARVLAPGEATSLS